MGTRASDVVAYIDETSSFGLKFRIETVGGNSIEVAVSSPRNLCFGMEEKMRFSGGEMVFHRIKIRTEAVNVAEINEEEIRGVVSTPLWSVAEKGVLSGGIYGSPPDGDSETGRCEAIFNFEILGNRVFL